MGPDGSAVFDAALGTGFCDSMDPEQIACTVAEIQQELDTTKSLTVRYDVTGPLETWHDLDGYRGAELA